MLIIQITRNRSVRSSILNLEHVKQLLSGEVPGEGLQRLLAMHEDDRVALLQEVLRG